MKKKYFMKGTDDELQFNDIIELDFVGEEDGVTKHSHLEIEFLPELVDQLLEEEIIEVQETDEEDEDLIDFGVEDKQLLQDAIKDIAELDERIRTLESMVKTLKTTVLSIQKTLKKK